MRLPPWLTIETTRFGDDEVVFVVGLADPVPDEVLPLDDPGAWAKPSGAGKRLDYQFGSFEDLLRSRRAAEDIYGPAGGEPEVLREVEDYHRWRGGEVGSGGVELVPLWKVFEMLGINTDLSHYSLARPEDDGE